MEADPYMMDPPLDQDRWDAGSSAPTQIILGACLFTLATVVYGLRILTRVRLQKNALRLDDRELVPFLFFMYSMLMILTSSYRRFAGGMLGLLCLYNGQ